MWPYVLAGASYTGSVRLQTTVELAAITSCLLVRRGYAELTRLNPVEVFKVKSSREKALLTLPRNQRRGEI